MPLRMSLSKKSDDLEPYHPVLVVADKEQYFLRMIDPTQSSPMKCEVELLKEIEKLGLHKQIRVPLLKGVVDYNNSETGMMGFLLYHD